MTPTASPSCPAQLEGALRSLYGNYEKAYRALGGDRGDSGGLDAAGVHRGLQQHQRSPRWSSTAIAGWETTARPTAAVVVRPASWRCSPTSTDGRLVAPAQHDPGRLRAAGVGRGDERGVQARSPPPRSRSSRPSTAQRFPGRDADELTDEDLLREVMNTVGKPGKLGEHVRCVVSVSMLTEGWDANTVTHILGVRAFGTQLLCEQVVGRGLRRRSLRGRRRRACSTPSTPRCTASRSRFIPTPAIGEPPKPRAAADPGARPARSARTLRDHVPAAGRLPVRAARRAGCTRDFTDDDRLAALHRGRARRRPRCAGIVGEDRVHTLDDLRASGEQGGRVPPRHAASLERYFPTRTATSEPWLFPQLLPIVRRVDAPSASPARTTPSPRCCCSASSRPTPSSASTGPSSAPARGETAPLLADAPPLRPGRHHR